jgi:hypothetical protein
MNANASQSEMWCSTQQDTIAAVDFGKAALRCAGEMECITGAEESPGIQFLERVTSAADHGFGQRKPVPKAKTFIALELLPHGRCVLGRNMPLAKMAMHAGIKLCSPVKRTAAAGASVMRLTLLYIWRFWR